MNNLYSKNFQICFKGGSFNRCPHGYTGWRGCCWRCGIFHPFRFIRDFCQDHSA